MGKYNSKYNTEYAREWRREARKALVAAMGGSCRVCGYDACISALDFHHLDSDTKDNEIGKLMAQRAWVKMKKEALKTILLCCRCHRELHAGHIEYEGELPEYEFPDKLNIRTKRYGD